MYLTPQFLLLRSGLASYIKGLPIQISTHNNRFGWVSAENHIFFIEDLVIKRTDHFTKSIT